jgi:hypothetical protein
MRDRSLLLTSGGIITNNPSVSTEMPRGAAKLRSPAAQVTILFTPKILDFYERKHHG